MKIPLGCTGPLEQWMPKVMERIAAIGLVPLTPTLAADGLGVREWRPIFDADGTWLQKILVQCADEQELRRLHRTVQGSRISFGGHEAAIELESLYVNLDEGGLAPPGNTTS